MGRRLATWFPDREFFMRSQGQVRFIKITSRMQIAAASIAVAALFAWAISMAVMGWSQYRAEAERASLLDREARVATKEERFDAYSNQLDDVAADLQQRQEFIEAMVDSLPDDVRAEETVSDSSTEAQATVDKVSALIPEAAALAQIEARQLVFVERLTVQKKQLDNIPFSAKFGGATGNFNAHVVAYPQVDWAAFADDLVNNVLGLSRSKTTTQIEHYDNLAAFCDNLKRINTILTDLDRDVWAYISMDYFKQKIKKGEVGSSVMPHKVNPIDFENSEGNLGVANAIFEHLAAKLPISRLQRDLTDSTVTRNIGVPIAHTLIGLKSLLRGLGKLILNADVIQADLQKNWAVVAEAIQTILRREGYPEPYETLKALTRTHAGISEKTIAEFIESLDVSRAVKDELLKITPSNYTGIFDLA